MSKILQHVVGAKKRGRGEILDRIGLDGHRLSASFEREDVIIDASVDAM
jgi:hypothetical protein